MKNNQFQLKNEIIAIRKMMNLTNEITTLTSQVQNDMNRAVLLQKMVELKQFLNDCQETAYIEDFQRQAEEPTYVSVKIDPSKLPPVRKIKPNKGKGKHYKFKRNSNHI